MAGPANDRTGGKPPTMRELHASSAASTASTSGRLRKHQRHVEHHADGDEEQSQQHVAERLDVLFHLIAELGFRNQHAGDKGAQRQRQAGQLRSARPGPA
jgi:hypothetical protein